MIDFTLKQVVEAVKAVATFNINEDKHIEGVAIDSRELVSDMLFVPIVGQRFNGHEFVVSCIGKGAVAALWQADQPYRPEGVALIVVKDTVKALQDLAKAYRKTLDMTFIAITGSSGKTTTKDMIAAVASVGFTTQKTSANHNNEIGLPLTILQLRRSTKIAVIEIGIDNFNEMDTLVSIVRPDVAVITSISESHIDNLGSLDAIVAEKYKITNKLNKRGLLIYNGDTPLLAAYVNKHKLIQKSVSYGFTNKRNAWVISKEITDNGIDFVTSLFPEFTFHLNLLGEYEILNAMSAILCGISLGMNAQEIQKGFDSLEITSMREDVKKIGNCTIIDSTYNSNPGSLNAAIKMLGDYPNKGKKIAIIGDMYGLGEQCASLHSQVGKTADLHGINEIWTIGPNARLIGLEVLKRSNSVKVVKYDTKEEVFKPLESILNKNLVILIKASRAVELDKLVKHLEEKSHD